MPCISPCPGLAHRHPFPTPASTPTNSQGDLPSPSMPVGSMSTRLVLIGRFEGGVAALKERYTKELQSFLAPGYYVLR